MATLLSADVPLARRFVLGFVAGAVAVLAFHQVVVLLLGLLGAIPPRAYAITPVPPFSVPTIVNSLFWGGLWGVVFALIADRLPRAWPLWLSGLVFGLLGPLMFNWFVVAPLKGQAMAAGFVPLRMYPGVLILGAFGIGVALILQALSRWGWQRGQRGLA
jgi:hypothetical protein